MTSTDDPDGEYVLGTDRAELERLESQHTAWLEQAYALWKRAGLRGGDRVVISVDDQFDLDDFHDGHLSRLYR